MPEDQKRGKRNLSGELGKLAKVVKERLFKNEEYKETAERLQQESNDKIASAISILQEAELGDEYIDLLNGESAPKVLQAVEALPEKQKKGNNLYRKRAAKKALEPFRHYKNLERLLKADKRLTKGDKKAHENYLVAFSRVFPPEKLDELKSLIDGDSSQALIKAKLTKLTEGLYQRAREIDCGVSDTISTFCEKIIEGKKVLDQGVEAAQRAIDQRAQEINRDIEKEKDKLDEQANETGRTIDSKAGKAEKDLEKKAKELVAFSHVVRGDVKKGKTELDKHTQETKRDLDQKVQEIRQEVDQKKADLDSYTQATYKAFDSRARNLRALERRLEREEVAFEEKIRRAGRTIDKRVQNVQKAMDKKVRKHQKQKRGYKKAVLVTAAALGALGLYSVLGKTSQPPVEPIKIGPEKALIIPKGRPYRVVELIRDRHYGNVLAADGKLFYKNPLDKKDPRFYPRDIVAKMEAGEAVPSHKRNKWFMYRTDEFKGGADVNHDRKKDLIDSKGHTYVSHPRARNVFMTGEKLRKELLK